MSNEKLIIQKLVALATKQQKILEKLAQVNPPPPAQSLPEPAHPNLRPAQTLLNALPPNAKKSITNIEEHGSEMRVQFAPGQRNQANYDAVLKTLQQLTSQNVIQKAYQVVAV